MKPKENHEIMKRDGMKPDGKMKEQGTCRDCEGCRVHEHEHEHEYRLEGLTQRLFGKEAVL